MVGRFCAAETREQTITCLAQLRTIVGTTETALAKLKYQYYFLSSKKIGELSI